MAEAAPEDGVERYLQRSKRKNMARRLRVEREAQRTEICNGSVVGCHRWNGKKTRVPACRAVLNINCHFLHSFQAGDDVEILQVCTDASRSSTSCGLIGLRPPARMMRNPSPFDLLVDEVSKGNVMMKRICTWPLPRLPA